MMGERLDRMKRLMDNPAESEQIRAVAGAFAAMEREQRAEVRRLADAAGVDVDLPALPDHDDRVTQMTDTLGAKLKGDPWEVYADHLAPDALETGKARQYAGLSPDDWHHQREEWVVAYRGMEDVETADLSDEQLAEYHVKSTFGVDLETFETEVIEWSEAETLQAVIAGAFETNTEGVETVADALEGADA